MVKLRLLRYRGVGEALVVAEVEVGLRAVLRDEDLPVLEGVHGAGVHVDIGVELFQGDREAPRFEKGAYRGGSKSLAQ